MANEETLKAIATRMIWWQPPEVSLGQPRQLVAQIMNRGSWEDVKFAQSHFGLAAFRDALAGAQPGWFEPDSWVIWHNAFELPVPEAPRRKVLGDAPLLNWKRQ